VTLTLLLLLTAGVNDAMRRLGGEFVLRIAYGQALMGWCVQARMMTPVYHPTIGPQGEVAVIMTEDRDVPYEHIPFAV